MLAKAITGNSGMGMSSSPPQPPRPHARNNLIASLDPAPSSLPNLDARFQSPVWDRDLRWGLPYMVERDRHCLEHPPDETPRSWSALCAAQAVISMLDDPETIGGVRSRNRPWERSRRELQARSAHQPEIGGTVAINEVGKPASDGISERSMSATAVAVSGCRRDIACAFERALQSATVVATSLRCCAAFLAA